MSDYLKHGEEMAISRRVHYFEHKEITALTALPLEELQARREKSAAAETAVFDKLCEDAKAWETQASETMLIDMAIEYAKTPAVEHTANKWQPDGYGHGQEISNMVYKMYHHGYGVQPRDKGARSRGVVSDLGGAHASRERRALYRLGSRTAKEAVHG